MHCSVFVQPSYSLESTYLLMLTLDVLLLILLISQKNSSGYFATFDFCLICWRTDSVWVHEMQIANKSCSDVMHNRETVKMNIACISTKLSYFIHLHVSLNSPPWHSCSASRFEVIDEPMKDEFNNNLWVYRRHTFLSLQSYCCKIMHFVKMLQDFLPITSHEGLHFN